MFLWIICRLSQRLFNNARSFPEFFRSFFRKVPAILGLWPTLVAIEIFGGLRDTQGLGRLLASGVHTKGVMQEETSEKGFPVGKRFLFLVFLTRINSLVGKCSATRCSVAAPPPGARHCLGGPMHPRHPLRWQRESGATGAFGRGVAASDM